MDARAEMAAYIADRPHLKSRTLAAEIVEQFPALMLTLEQARDRVRYYRGEHGEDGRRKRQNAGGIIPTTKYSAPEAAAPDFKPYDLPAVGKGLIIADLHMPYHDKAAVDTAINHAIKTGHTEHLIILGDLPDFYQLSFFNRNPKRFSLEMETEAVTNFLADMTKIFGCVIYKAGNHEQRLQSYIFRKAPELAGVKSLELSRLLNLHELGVTFVNWCDPIYAGDNLTLVHGHEYGRSMFSPVNAARGLFLRALACSVTAHYHRTSHHDEPDIRGTDISTWSIGCLCNLHPEYARLNKWNHGFMLMNFNGGDDWDVSNHRIVNGHVR